MNTINAQTCGPTPEMVAQAFWDMDTEQQIAFFAHLDTIAGYKLCLQMGYLVCDMAEASGSETANKAIAAFRRMADHAEDYPTVANDWRATRATWANARDAEMAKEMGL